MPGFEPGSPIPKLTALAAAPHLAPIDGGGTLRTLGVCMVALRDPRSRLGTRKGGAKVRQPMCKRAACGARVATRGVPAGGKGSAGHQHRCMVATCKGGWFPMVHAMPTWDLAPHFCLNSGAPQQWDNQSMPQVARASGGRHGGLVHLQTGAWTIQLGNQVSNIGRQDTSPRARRQEATQPPP